MEEVLRPGGSGEHISAGVLSVCHSSLSLSLTPSLSAEEMACGLGIAVGESCPCVTDYHTPSKTHSFPILRRRENFVYVARQIQ